MGGETSVRERKSLFCLQKRYRFCDISPSVYWGIWVEEEVNGSGCYDWKNDKKFVSYRDGVL